MKIFVWILLFLLVINVIAALITVFRKPRSISSVLAWMMTLIFLPGIGFIIYLFCGRGIDGQEVFKLSDDEKQMVQRIKEKVDVDNKKAGRDKRYDLLYDAKVLNRYFRNMDASPLAKRNSLQLFTDGQEKFQALFEDIRAAKETVHVEYYAFFNDTIGNQFLDVLIEKLHEGVEVYLIYDPWGSPGANKKFFARYVDAGGKVAPFITSRDMIRKTRLNYHLHRKFETFVKVGERVRLGQKLLSFDKQIIQAAGYDPTVLVIVTNTAEMAVIETTKQTEITPQTNLFFMQVKEQN
ncbi:TPA: hypothetical protein IUV87_000110 [Enterococcus faecalis]|nr:hypothetical protein [Enterococcus faecalis]